MGVEVHVQARDGTPLMPTKRHGHIQRLLDRGMAKAVGHTPPVIRLRYDSTRVVQPLFGGTDPGRTSIGNAVIDGNGTVIYTETVQTKNRGIIRPMSEHRHLIRAHVNAVRRIRKFLPVDTWTLKAGRPVGISALSQAVPYIRKELGSVVPSVGICTDEEAAAMREILAPDVAGACDAVCIAACGAGQALRYVSPAAEELRQL